jgi:hypothetical protein
VVPERFGLNGWPFEPNGWRIERHRTRPRGKMPPAVKRRLVNRALLIPALGAGLLGPLLICAFWMGDGAKEYVRHTAHYTIRSDVPVPDDVTSMMEDLHAVLQDFLNDAPRETLQVVVLAKWDGFKAALSERSVGALPSARAQGVMCPKTGEVIVCAAGRPAEFRKCLLHECVHQFRHYTARPSTLPIFLLEEGLAEHFAIHRLAKGSRAEFASLPDPSDGDMVGVVLRGQAGEPSRLTRIASTTEKVGYSEAWAVISFLLRSEPRQFRAWLDQLDRGVPPERAWATTFAACEGLNQRFRAWLQSIEPTLVFVGGDWVTDKAVVRTSGADALSLALVRTNVSGAAVRVVPSDDAQAGVILNYDQFAHFVAIRIGNSRVYTVDRWEAGGWRRLSSGHVSRGDVANSFVFQIDGDGSSAVVTINGTAACTVPRAPSTRLGLIASGGAAEFVWPDESGALGCVPP